MAQGIWNAGFKTIVSAGYPALWFTTGSDSIKRNDRGQRVPNCSFPTNAANLTQRHRSYELCSADVGLKADISKHHSTVTPVLRQVSY